MNNVAPSIHLAEMVIIFAGIVWYFSHQLKRGPLYCRHCLALYLPSWNGGHFCRTLSGTLNWNWDHFCQTLSGIFSIDPRFCSVEKVLTFFSDSLNTLHCCSAIQLAQLFVLAQATSSLPENPHRSFIVLNWRKSNQKVFTVVSSFRASHERGTSPITLMHPQTAITWHYSGQRQWCMRNGQTDSSAVHAMFLCQEAHLRTS